MAVTTAAMIAAVVEDVVAGVRVAVTGRRKQMSTDVVVNWAIGPGNVSPKQRSRPILSRMRRSCSWWPKRLCSRVWR
jgi:hypothetical protein